VAPALKGTPETKRCLNTVGVGHVPRKQAAGQLTVAMPALDTRRL
jgi:hypothetical protein